MTTDYAVRLKDYWREDTYLSHINLSKYKVLSLDIFDTLLFRGCEKPDDVFLEAGTRGEVRGLLYKGINSHGFYKIRKTAAIRAHKHSIETNGYREVSLETIYSFIPNELCDREAMLQLELRVEKDFCYINPSVESLLIEAKKLGLRIALTSDMYLSQKQLFDLLQNSGLDISLIDALFVSSEHKGNKASGILFQRMLEGINASNSDVVHIGDNVSADIKGAQLVGIQSCFYNVIPPKYDSVYELETIKHTALLPELLSLRKLAGALGAKYTEKDQFWYEFGATVLGPYFTLFTEWIIDTCETEQIQYVHPFMREGNFFTEMLKNTVDSRQSNIVINELFVSRTSTYFAAINQFQENEINYYFMRVNATVGGLFTALDLKHKYTQFEQYYNVLLKNTDNTLCEQKTLRESLIEFILSDEIQEHINGTILHNRSLLLKYLHHKKTQTPYAFEY